MFDIGWSEMALIAVVAIVVIGPKDLPKVMRAVGQFTARARGMAREFQNSMDDLARETDLADAKRDLERLAQLDIKSEVEKRLDPAGDIRKSFDEAGAALRPPVEEATPGTVASAVAAGPAETTPSPEPRPQPDAGPQSEVKP